MECNRDEAVRAKDMAEKTLASGDTESSKRFLNIAEKLCPGLEGLAQLATVVNVHCAAKVKFGTETDHYGVLQVEILADDAAIKKQYRKLALALHPDKNKLDGAEAAFKFVGEAFQTLSDVDKRRKFNHARAISMTTFGNARVNRVPPTGVGRPVPGVVRPTFYTQQQHQPSVNLNTGGLTFWTKCINCSTSFQYDSRYINMRLACTQCHKMFYARVTEPPLNPPTNHRRPPVPAPPPVTSTHPAFTNLFRGTNPAYSTEYVQMAFQKARQDREEKARKDKEDKQEAKRKLHDDMYRQAQEEAERMRNRDAGVGTSGEADEQQIGQKPENEEQVKRRGSKPRKRVKCFLDMPEPPPKRTRGRRGAKCVINMEDENDEDHKPENEAEEVSKDDSVSVEANGKPIRRSNRRRNQASYKYDVDDDLQEFPKKKTGNASTSTSSVENGDMNGASSCMSTGETKARAPDESSISVPDNVFHNFDDERAAKLAPNQFWAAYDETVAMPRFYCRINEVNNEDKTVTVSWLEGLKVKWWRKMGLYAGCGEFTLEKVEVETPIGALSHQISVEPSGGTRYGLYPKTGEIWCLYDGWSRDWKVAPEEDHSLLKLNVVEVLTDFAKGTGGSVRPLEKVPSYKAVFRRPKDAVSIQIDAANILCFSHMVLSVRLTGEGQPDGWELDSGALSDVLLEVIG